MSSVHMTLTITSSLKSGVTGTIMNPEPCRTITSDDWDQKYDEPNFQQPILSTMTDDLGNTVERPRQYSSRSPARLRHR